MIKLKYGNTSTYLIKGDYGNLLIATDYAGSLFAFFKELKKNNLKIEDINYVIATHYHPDHMGLIGELQKYNVKLIIVNNQLDYIDFSYSIFNKDKIKYIPINIDDAIIINEDESRKLLAKMGINGEIIITPSHSKDSISIVLDDGNCFVGDLEPYSYIGGYIDNDDLKRDWELINKYKPKVVHFGHINDVFLD